MKKKKVIATEKFESTEIKNVTFNNEDYQKVVSFFIVLAIVLALLGLLYYFNGNLVTKDMATDKTTTTTTIPSYDETLILADNIFSISDKEYMVLIFDSSDTEDGFLYNGLYNGYRGTKVVYGVDLANKMNASHYNSSLESENKTPTKASEIVVSGARLLVIKDKKVTEYISEKDAITEKLRAK